MNLPGRLRLTTLGDVLGAIHRAGASGVLELTEDRGLTHRVFWADGMITQVDTALFRERLGDLLAGQGFLGARALARLARRLLEAPRQRAGEILVEEGFVSSDLVSAGLRRQLRQKLEALFKLTDAQLTFRVPRPHQQHQSPLSPGEFLHGRPRARPRARYAAAQERASNSQPSAGASSSPRAPHGARSRAYATLGLLPGADRASIQQAFRRLARNLHPDRFPHADPSERARLLSRFAELSAAYHSLAG
ncbi:MAG TPA: J domain-containing protein [Polyangiaceae bacterium]|nr:J domain-containing protein [Polyangiaceae bacterium]